MASIIERLKSNDFFLLDINFESETLSEVTLQRFSVNLPYNTNILSINLSNSNLTSNSLSNLTLPLSYHPSLMVLDFGYNYIGDKGSYHLAECLITNTTLTYLNVQYNNIGDDGAVAFSRLLENNTTLDSLYLWNNDDISPEIGGTSLLHSLQKFNTTITELKVYANYEHDIQLKIDEHTQRYQNNKSIEIKNIKMYSMDLQTSLIEIGCILKKVLPKDISKDSYSIVLQYLQVCDIVIIMKLVNNNNKHDIFQYIDPREDEFIWA